MLAVLLQNANTRAGSERSSEAVVVARLRDFDQTLEVQAMLSRN